MIQSHIKNFFTRNLAVDLGTVNTLIYSIGDGIILNQPSTIASNKYTGEVLAIGQEAEHMFGQEPYGVVVHHPLRGGTIADCDLTEKLIKGFLGQIGSRWKYTRVFLCTPLSASDIERDARFGAVRQAGVNTVELIDEELAAALGSGALDENSTKMVIDIGGGMTNFSVISQHGLILSWGLKVAGAAMTEAIICYIEQKDHITLSYQTAEDLKIQLGSATKPEENHSLSALGKLMVDGTPQVVKVSAADVAQTLEQPLQSILGAVQFVFKQMPVEAARCVYRNGIVLTGGGSLLRNLETRLFNELGILVRQDPNPLEAVALGAGQLVDNPRLFKKFNVIRTTEALKEASVALPFSKTLPQTHVENGRDGHFEPHEQTVGTRWDPVIEVKRRAG